MLSFSIEKYLRLKLILYLLGLPSIPLGDPSPAGHKIFRQSAARGQLQLHDDVPADQHQQGPGGDVLLQGLHQLRGNTLL